MRKTEGSLIIALAMVILITSTTGSWATASKSNIQFKDTKPTDWYMATVSKLVELKGIQGFPDGTFKPNLQIKKGEFIKILMASLDFDEGIAAPEETNHWASNYLKKAKSLGIVDYYDLAYNQLDEVITRNEMAKMVVRAVEYKGEKHIEDRDKYIGQIKDYYDIPNKEIRIKDIDTTKIKGYGHYTLNKDNGLYSVYNDYKDYVLKAYTKGLISGYPDGEFKGTKGLSRAEASSVIIRVLGPTERKLPTEVKEEFTVSTKTRELTEEDIKRLQGYKTDARIGFKDFDKKEAKAVIDSLYNEIFIPKNFKTHALIAENKPYSELKPVWGGYYNLLNEASEYEFITDIEAVYDDILSTGIRGILRIKFDRNNSEGLGTGKFYERDAEFATKYSDNMDGTTTFKLFTVRYLSPWKEVK